MPGERFSLLYARPGDLASDSARARHRIGTLFRETVFNGHLELLAAYLGRNLGILLPGDGKYPSTWHQFVRECRIADFLDAVTLVYRYFFWHVSEETASWWREAIRKIFAEEHLAYQIDDIGGVHPRIDEEFQRNLGSAIAALKSERYHAVRELLERASGHLSAEPANYKQALRATWAAADALFALMFPRAQLTADEMGSRLRPLVERIYAQDAATKEAALGMLTGFQTWVEAATRFRHRPGTADGAQPPADVAILSISCAAALLRWLVGLDEHLAA